jgi:hypothetical protein
MTFRLLLQTTRWWGKGFLGLKYIFQPIFTQKYLLSTIKTFLNHLINQKHSKITKKQKISKSIMIYFFWQD